MPEQYSEKHVVVCPPLPSSALRDAACNTLDDLSPEERHVNNLLSVRADSYAAANVGTSVCTYVFPTPLSALYRATCVVAACRPNVALLSSFSADATNCSLLSIDLAGMYLGGDKGMLSVVLLLRECCNVQRCNFSFQFISSSVMEALLPCCQPVATPRHS